MRVAAVALAAGLLLGACGSNGHTVEDERRLAAIAADPMASEVPPGASITSGPTEILAETTDGRYAGCCSNNVVTRFTSTNAIPDLAEFYVARLADGGWSDITVACLSSTTQVTAGRQFDGFVGRFIVEFSAASDPVSAFRTVSAPFHTAEFDAPIGVAPDTTCLNGDDIGG